MRMGRPDKTIAKLGARDVCCRVGVCGGFHQETQGPEVLDGDAAEDFEDGGDEAEEEHD